MFNPIVCRYGLVSACNLCVKRQNTHALSHICNISSKFKYNNFQPVKEFGWHSSADIVLVKLKYEKKLFSLHHYGNLSRLFSTSFLFNNKQDSQTEWKKDKLSENTNKTEDIKEEIFTIPNLLTASRIVATPFLGFLVVHQSYPLALGIFCAAGFTDLLDGYIARKFNQKTVLGSALDPLADKLLVSVLTITLTLVNLIPLPLAVIILGRDVLLVAASLYLRYISLPPPKTFSRYCDVTNATVQLHPSVISKINTFLQLSLLASSLAAPVFGFVDHGALQILWVLTGTTTVASGVGYYITRNKSVEFLQDKMKRKL